MPYGFCVYVLNEDTATFTIEEMGWEVKLAYEGDYEGQYVVCINDTNVTNLPM